MSKCPICFDTGLVIGRPCPRGCTTLYRLDARGATVAAPWPMSSSLVERCAVEAASLLRRRATPVVVVGPLFPGICARELEAALGREPTDEEKMAYDDFFLVEIIR